MVPGTDAVFEYIRKNNAEKKNRKMLEFKRLKKYDGIQQKKPAPRAGFYKKREKYEKNLSNNCFLLFDGFILQQVCEQHVSEE